VTKEQEDAARAAEVRRANFTQLKQLETDAGNLRGMLDTTSTTVLNSFNTGLVQMTMNFKNAGEEAKNMGLNIVRALLDATYRMIIIKPIAAGLQATLGALLPGLGGTGALSTDSFADVSKTATSGADLARTMSFAGMKAGGGSIPTGMWGIAGEAGPEVISGPATVTPISQAKPQLNLIINEAPGVRNDVTRNNDGSITIDQVMRANDLRQARQIATGSGNLGRAVTARQGRADLAG
jgi:hypothetical protein